MTEGFCQEITEKLKASFCFHSCSGLVRKNFCAVEKCKNFIFEFIMQKHETWGERSNHRSKDRIPQLVLQMKRSSQRFSLITSALSLFLCTSHSLQLPLPLPWFFTLRLLAKFLFESFQVPPSVFFSPYQFPLYLPPSLSTFRLSRSFVPPSLPLHVGCVICKCADSCSRSPSFDSAVGVINGSANCDSSQTRWEQLRQPISTLFLSFLSVWSPLSISITHTHCMIFTETLAHLPPKTNPETLEMGSSPSGWLVRCFPALSRLGSSFVLIFLLPSFLFPTTPCSNFSALWPSHPPRAYLSL